MTGPIILDLENNLKALPGLRQEIDQALMQLDCDPINIQHFQLAATEIFTNLLEHSDPKPHRIEVLAGRENDEVFIEITDNGGPLKNMNEVIEKACKRFEDADLPTAGMGLHLVTTLFDRHEYKPANGGRVMNRFRLVLNAKN